MSSRAHVYKGYSNARKKLKHEPKDEEDEDAGQQQQQEVVAGRSARGAPLIAEHVAGGGTPLAAAHAAAAGKRSAKAGLD